mgnify:CR=1 FL=1
MNKKIKQILEGQSNELSVKDISKYDLVSIADLMLKTAIRNSKFLENGKWKTDMDIKKARVVHSYLRSLLDSFGRKLQQVRLDTDIDKKIKAIESLKKKGHFK